MVQWFLHKTSNNQSCTLLQIQIWAIDKPWAQTSVACSSCKLGQQIQTLLVDLSVNRTQLHIHQQKQAWSHTEHRIDSEYAPHNPDSNMYLVVTLKHQILDHQLDHKPLNLLTWNQSSYCTEFSFAYWIFAGNASVGFLHPEKPKHCRSTKRVLYNATASRGCSSFCLQLLLLATAASLCEVQSCNQAVGRSYTPSRQNGLHLWEWGSWRLCLVLVLMGCAAHIWLSLAQGV